MGQSKNDIAWEKLFEKHQIINRISQEGQAVISATQINEFREARLMTKFDHRSQLPTLFSDNNYSILPINRGSYIIGSFETFHNFSNESVPITKINYPTFLESLDFKDISSEATAINCAFVSNILRDFTNEENLFPTVSGRMSSSIFDFEIDALKGSFTIQVDNAQIEIDGGYEGDNSLNLIEAKNYISDDFLVRQLFYPFKLWTNKIRKVVRPIFLTYSNGIFHLREYKFLDKNRYNSLSLVQQKKYAVKDEEMNIEFIQKAIHETKSIAEPDVPFPQADSFERVVNLCELLSQKGFTTKEDITRNYDFDSRQTDYYSNAGRYLGLINIGRDETGLQVGCFLSENGERIFKLTIFERQFEFIKVILSHNVFKKSLGLYFAKGASPSKEEIVTVMKESNLYHVNSESTYFRRASTITGWINWIIDQIEE